MWMRAVGVKVDPLDGPTRIVPVGGRAYMDLTDFMRSKWTRTRLPEGLEVYGPRVRSAIERLLDDPRFAPRPGLPFRLRSAIIGTLRLAPGAVAGIARSLARPEVARARVFRGIERINHQSVAPAELATAAERLRFVVEDVQRPVMGPDMMDVTWPLITGMLLPGAASFLLRGIATDAEMDTTLGGMPHNVTTEMDLALWQVAQRAAAHRELLNATPDELAARYRDGTLPGIGLEAFLGKYGQRAAAEIDVGMPRWDEDPAPIFAAIANYLRLDDPEQAPDRRFERAAANAEATIEELVRRTRRMRPLRGRLAGFLLRRARALTGLREIGKFAWLGPLRETRRQLLLIGAELAGRGLLDCAGDIMFLDFRETQAAVYDGADHRDLVAARRAVYDRELRRTSVPAALLSDGTDVEALTPAAPAGDGTLTGMAAAPGTATGRARVIRDPAGAHIEPGEILVAPTTDPGWTPLFLTTAGLVTETGSTVAHGPTVAREYGIPAVICVRNATQEIKTGQLITIDGAAGTVRIEADVD